MSILRRLLCGVLVAAAAGIVAWIAAQLTVGMILSRHLNSYQHLWAARLWIAGCVAAGFAAGVLFRRDVLTMRLGWICWGAVASLTILTLGTYVCQAFVGNHSLRIPGSRIHLTLDEISLCSAPAALIVGGVLGWFVHRQSATGRYEAQQQLTE